MRMKRNWVLPIIVFFLVGTMLSGLYLSMTQEAVAQNRKRYEYIAKNESNIIRDYFDVIMARAYTLGALITGSNGDVDIFDQAAEQIYLETLNHTGIPLKNIAVAPNGVVEKVYPMDGNEELIGFDFMDESKAGNEEAIAAYRQDKLLVTDPFKLVQGGVGMAGRLPVFLAQNNTSEFWGLVTVTLDFDAFLKHFELDSLSKAGVSYELWYENDAGQHVTLAASPNATVDPVHHSFSLLNLKWHIDVSPSNGWTGFLEIAVALSIILGVSLLIALLLLDQAHIKQTNKKLERLVHLDSLTSCYSRHYVNTVLVNQRNGRWNDPNFKYSLVIIDIDHFKNINDTYGHEVGDRAIVAIAQLLEDNSKSENGDCVIRHGGDEFIVLFNNVSRERFEKKLRAIARGAEAIHFTDYPDLHLTVSMGGDYYISPEQSLYYDMVRRADKNLYFSKESGRNQFVL